jgi:5-methylcytosine-specific restriction endonuclease McrA
MARPFDFDQRTRREAFLRHWNRCAHCGRSLSDLFDHSHHVIPNQTGSLSNPADAFLRSVDNCVILCDTCHERVHEDGRYRTGAVAPAEYYPYSHGTQTAQRSLWIALIHAEWRRIFPGSSTVT